MNDKEARITVIANMVGDAIRALEAADEAAGEYGLDLDATFIRDALIGAHKAKRGLQRLLKKAGGEQ